MRMEARIRGSAFMLGNHVTSESVGVKSDLFLMNGFTLEERVFIRIANP